MNLRLKFQDAADPFEGESLRGQLGDLAQARDVLSAVQTVAPRDARGHDEPRAVVLPQGLRVEPGEFRRDGDRVDGCVRPR